MTAPDVDGLREAVAEALIEHPSIPRYDGNPANYRCPRCPDADVAGPNSPSHADHQADAVLAVFRPLLDAITAERDGLSDINEVLVRRNAALREQIDRVKAMLDEVLMGYRGGVLPQAAHNRLAEARAALGVTE